MREKEQSDVYIFVKAGIAFLVFMVLCIAVFFIYVEKDVENNIQNTIENHVERQSYHLKSVIDTHYGYMEAIARFIGSQDEITGENAMEIVRYLYEDSGFERMAIIDEYGNATYDNGVEKVVSSREYFQEAMKGKRTLSDPVESKVDGEDRVILCVPVYRHDKVAGVLCGSYNVGTLSNILFEDIYDDEGYCYIVTKDGDMVSMKADKQYQTIGPEDNFFDYYSKVKILSKYSMEEIYDDFMNRERGGVEIDNGGDRRYLTYEPLELNDWMLCYVVPVKKAREPYGFIRTYEIIFCLVLAAGVAALLFFVIVTNNRRQKLLMRYAHTDALTGCWNKRNTENLINEWLSDPRCTGIQAFLMLDVDKFKEINDGHGHAVGDLVLREVGDMLRSRFRENDIIGRIGGDEFVILMKNVPSEELAIDRAVKLVKMFREMEIEEMNGAVLTSSMGLAFSPGNGRTFTELYQCADEALYETKKKGRNGYTVYSEKMDDGEQGENL